MTNKISIIVPVYNREKTIVRCIDSIKRQHYTNFECIIVDDGSLDSSLDMIRGSIDKDERFIVIRKDNGGVGSARNCGLDLATGDWVVFVDSDDEILPNHLSSYIDSLEDDVDLLFSGYLSKHETCEEFHKYENAIYKGVDEIKSFLSETDVILYMPICDKMYKRSLIEEYKIRFDTSLSLSEDRLFTYNFLLHIKGVKTLSSITYLIHAYDEVGRLTHRKMDLEQNVYRCEQLSEVINKLIVKYNISLVECPNIWRYHWAVFFSVIESANTCVPFFFDRVKFQRIFWKNNFDIGLYDQIKHIPEIASMMNTFSNWACVKGFFFIYNLKLLIWRLWC